MKKIFQVAVVILLMILFLAACLPAVAPAQQQAPQVQNTQSSQDTQSNINTAVVQTIQAQNQIDASVAQTMAAQFTPTPTATLLAIPTLTPFTISTPATGPSSGGGGSSSGGGISSTHAKADYSCDIILLRPRAFAEFHRGQKFDIKMTVVNNGARAWYQGFDLKYTGGPIMTSVTRVELPAMAPDARHEVILDAIAPDVRGDQTMTWAVDGRICFGYVTISVK